MNTKTQEINEVIAYFPWDFRNDSHELIYSILTKYRDGELVERKPFVYSESTSLDSKQIIKRLCELQALVYRSIGDEVLPADCFCGEAGFWGSEGYDGTHEGGYRNSGFALQFIEQAVREKLGITTLTKQTP